MSLITIIILVMLLLYFAQKSSDAQNSVENTQKLEKDMQLICPHCQSKGTVTTRQIKKKAGIHGGKATAAVITCGLSMFATGLSQKNTVTEAHCNNCNSTWIF